MNTTYDLCVKQTHACVLTTPVRHRNSLYLDCNPQPSKEAGLLYPAEKTMHIIQWWDDSTLRSVCISHRTTLQKQSQSLCFKVKHTGINNSMKTQHEYVFAPPSLK